MLIAVLFPPQNLSDFLNETCNKRKKREREREKEKEREEEEEKERGKETEKKERFGQNAAIVNPENKPTKSDLDPLMAQCLWKFVKKLFFNKG